MIDTNVWADKFTEKKKKIDKYMYIPRRFKHPT